MCVTDAMIRLLAGTRCSPQLDTSTATSGSLERVEDRSADSPVAARGIVPEQLAPHRLGEGAPAQDHLDRLREPALRVGEVGGEHESILAERLDGVKQRPFALVDLDALEVLRPADVLAGLLRERRQGVSGHLGELIEAGCPGRQPAVAALERRQAQPRLAIEDARA